MNIIMRGNNNLHDEYLQIDDNAIVQENKQALKVDKRLLKHGGTGRVDKRSMVRGGEVVDLIKCFENWSSCGHRVVIGMQFTRFLTL